MKKVLITLILILAADISIAKEYDPKETRAKEYFREGFLLYNEAKFSDALISYKRGLSLKPDLAEIWYWMGKLYYRMGKIEEAIDCWNQFFVLGGGDQALRQKINNLYNSLYAKPKEGKLLSTYAHTGTIKPDKPRNRFYSPTGIARDSKGNIYIVSYDTHKVLKFSPAGNFILEFGEEGEGEGQLTHPFGIYIDKEDYLYITDFGNNRIAQFDSNDLESDTGGFLFSFGSRGIKEGELLGPEGITGDEFGNLYVVDSGNCRVAKFDKEGKFMLGMGKMGREEGELIQPVDVALDKDRNIWITDSGNRRIQQFDSSGNLLTALRFPNEKGEPRGITVSPKGDIYISFSKGSVYKFDRNLTLWAKISGFKEAEEFFICPQALMVDEEGHLYVTDICRDSIESFVAEEFKPTNFNLNVDRVITDHFPDVIYAVTVTSENQRAVLGLTADNFKIVEQGKRMLPVRVSSPLQEKDNLVTVFLIDTHLYMKSHQKKIEDLVDAYIERTKDNQSVASVTFSNEKSLLCPTTLNKLEAAKLATSLKFWGAEDEGVALPAGIKEGVDQTLNLLGRKAIVLFTSSDKINLKEEPLFEALYYAKNNYVPLIIIDFSLGKNNHDLKLMADFTGGKYFRTSESTKEIENLYNEVVKMTKNQAQYFLFYKSPTKEWTNTWIKGSAACGQDKLYGEDRAGFIVPESQERTPYK